MGDENYGIDRGLIQDICLGFSVPEQLCDVRLLSVNYFFVKSSKSGGHLGFKCSESSLGMSVKSTYCAFHKHANSKVQTAVNHNYDYKQRTLKQRNIRNGSKSSDHKSETMTF